MLRLDIGAAVAVQTGAASALPLSGKSAVVLAYVGLEGRAERRRLAGLLWPGSGEAQARNNLRVLVHRIHQRCGVELLGGDEALVLSGVALQLLEDGGAVLAALHAGGPAHCELLGAAGVDDDAGEALQAWLAQARARLRRRQLAGLGAALAQAQAQAQHAQAVALAQACVQLEPLSEPGHRQLMEVLARSGDRAAALAAYEACKTLLRQELGVLPDLITRTVQLRILQEQSLGPETPPQAHAPEPRALTPLGGAARYPLIEREVLLQQLHAALGRGTHVALQGEPGAGKTRVLRQLSGMAGLQQLAVRAGAHGEAYAALAQLLQELQPRCHARPGLPEQVELARLAPLVFPQVQPSQASLSAPRLHAALRAWWRALGEAGVRVLVIDDVHDADADSQAAFGALLQEEQGPTLVLAHRSAEIEPALEQALVAAQSRHRLRRLEVPRLTLAGVQALLQAMAYPAARATQLLKRTGGNPLFVIELAEAAENTDAADTADLQALLAARLARCGTPAQQLAAVAAAAGEDFSVELAAAVTQHTALALMPAWMELQQRGLFADHGLAHDLVQDAVLAGMPAAIKQQLHRQIALHLEAQGLQGATVMRHWIEADDADRALPHAVQQVYQVRGLRMPTRHLNDGLLKLMRRASDAVLLQHLWVTVSFNEPDLQSSVAEHLEALIERVTPHENDLEIRAWVACERSRLVTAKDLDPRRSYGILMGSVSNLPEQGLTRAYVEDMLCHASFAGDLGSLRLHAERGLRALANLPETPDVKSLLNDLGTALSLCMELPQALRQQANRRRAARRRFDLGGVSAANETIGQLLSAKGYQASAFRYVSPESLSPATGAAFPQLGFLAASAGRFQMALDLLGGVSIVGRTQVAAVFLAAVWLRLGQHGRARSCAQSVDPEALGVTLQTGLMHAEVRSALASRDGTDSLAPFHEALQAIGARDASMTARDLVHWQILVRTTTAAERAEFGQRLAGKLLTDGKMGGFAAEILVDLAESEQPPPRRRQLAQQVARLLRRRRCRFTNMIELACRCARLLQATDPAEAASLRYVARRWVIQALPHVPEDCLHSYVYDVPVNRELLGDDAPAAAAGTLRWVPPVTGV